MIPIVLPVRKQSERCPNKILRPFYGEKSLLDVALEKFENRKDVFVAAHEDEFAQKAKEYGVNFIPRSYESAMSEVALEVHAYLYDFDYEDICYFGVCSPLLRAETVDAAIKTYQEDSNINALFGVKACYDHMFFNDGTLIDNDNKCMNSKERQAKWIGTNSLSIILRKRFLEEGIFWKLKPGDPHVFEIAEEECWDIDTEQDFMIAQQIYAYQQEGANGS